MKKKEHVGHMALNSRLQTIIFVTKQVLGSHQPMHSCCLLRLRRLSTISKVSHSRCIRVSLVLVSLRTPRDLMMLPRDGQSDLPREVKISGRVRTPHPNAIESKAGCLGRWGRPCSSSPSNGAGCMEEDYSSPKGDPRRWILFT